MMTPEQILTKAIEQAIASGWHNYGHPARAFAIGKDPLRIEYSDGSSLHLYGLLYDKEWAKALWPTEHDSWEDDDSGTYECTNCGGTYTTNGYNVDKCYQWHLQQMVIADDPIQYLGENLPA